MLSEVAINRKDLPVNVPSDNQTWLTILIERAASGDIGAFEQIMMHSQQKVMALSWRLKDVLTQLRGTLNYGNYELATSVVQRLTETPRGLHGKGTAEISRSPAPAEGVILPYEYFINQVTLASTSTGAPIVQIGEFTFTTGLTSTKLDNRTQVQTALNLRDGEKVVVGTATLGDRALIIVLTAKVLN